MDEETLLKSRRIDRLKQLVDCYLLPKLTKIQVGKRQHAACYMPADIL